MADATEPNAETALRESDDVVTVSQLGDRLERLVASAGEVQGFYVVGEVSDADRWNGHVFFDLLDEDEDATLECILYSYLTDEFADRLEEGALVAVKGDVQFYAPKSVVSMQVAEVLSVGEGSHAARREELIATLDEEGLLADERKRELPPHPACIGVVTSPSGSALEDVVATVSDRDRTVDVKLHGATMQGEDAVRSIVEAIQSLDADPDVDCLLVTRGGGSDADLWTFNEEAVARCLAGVTTPVVAAIGHEDDHTVAEFVADCRANTPTGAVTTVVPDRVVIVERFRDLERRVRTAYAAATEPIVEDLHLTIDTAYSATVTGSLAAHGRRVDDAYDDAVSGRTTAVARRVDDAYQRFVDGRLGDYEARIDDAVTGIEHESALRQEREAVVSETRRTITRDRLVIAALVILLLALVAAILLGLV